MLFRLSLSLSLLLPSLSSAQEFILSTQIFEPLDGGRIEWADVDADGDLDILYFGRLRGVDAAAMHIYENVDGTYTENSSHSLPDFSNGDFGLADFDGDDDLDILISGFNYTKTSYFTALYRNSGGLTFALALSFKGLTNSTVSWADIDEDNDLDFLLTGIIDGELDFEPQTLLYENLGNDNFLEVLNHGLPPCGQCSMDWSDYNGDGFIDVVLTGFSVLFEPKSGVYRNKGNQTFEREENADLPGLFNGSASWGDFDNDDDLDIMLNGSLADQGGYRFQIFENQNGTWVHRTDITIEPLTETWQGSVRWADIDLDGYIDIIASGRAGGDISFTEIFHVYRNTGTGNFQRVPHTNLAAAIHFSLDLADYDTDGDIDIAFVSGDVVGIYDNSILPPEGLQAHITDDGYVLLSWEDISHEETSYKITRSLNWNDASVEVATLPANTTSFKDNFRPAAETFYYYTIHAEKAAQRSDNDSCKVLMSAAPDSLSGVSVNATRINFAWRDNSIYEDGYAVQARELEEGEFEQIAETPHDTKVYEASGLSEGTAYFVRIRARNQYGYSPPSDTLLIKTNTRPTSTTLQKQLLEDSIFSFSAADFQSVFSGNDENEILEQIIITEVPERGRLFLNDAVLTEGQSIPTHNLNDLRYDPQPNEFGNDKFLYRPHDGRDSSNTSATCFLEIVSINDPPSISAIDDVDFDDFMEVTPVSFSVIDVDDVPSEILITTSSSNEQLIKSDSIFITGTDTEKSIILLPERNHAGNSIITVSAFDGDTTVTEDFRVTISEVVLSTNDEIGSAFSIAPNPATTRFEILWSEVYPISVEVLDLLGRTASISIVQSKTDVISIDELVPGVYVLVVTDKNDRKQLGRLWKK